MSGCCVVHSDLLTRRSLVYWSNLSKQRMPRLRGIYANFSLGRTVLMQLILCKSHESLQKSPCYPLIVSHFLTIHALPFWPFAFLSHLTLDYFVMQSPWNHCRSTSSYRNCIFIIRHYSLASSLYPSIMHLPPLPCQSVPVPRSGDVCYVRSIIQVLLLNSVVPHVNGRSWMVVLCDVVTDAVPSLLVRESVDTSTDRQ